MIKSNKIQIYTKPNVKQKQKKTKLTVNGTKSSEALHSDEYRGIFQI